MAQKIRESKQSEPQGFSEERHTLERVRELAEGEAVPDGAVALPEGDIAPVCDWQVSAPRILGNVAALKGKE